MMRRSFLPTFRVQFTRPLNGTGSLPATATASCIAQIGGAVLQFRGAGGHELLSGTSSFLLMASSKMKLARIAKVGIFLLLASVLSSPLQSQQWARKMFLADTTHDFGIVAADSDALHRFELQNIYEEDIHIASVSSSCNCTIASDMQMKPQFKKRQKNLVGKLAASSQYAWVVRSRKQNKKTYPN